MKSQVVIKVITVHLVGNTVCLCIISVVDIFHSDVSLMVVHGERSGDYQSQCLTLTDAGTGTIYTYIDLYLSQYY